MIKKQGNQLIPWCLWIFLKPNLTPPTGQFRSPPSLTGHFKGPLPKLVIFGHSHFDDSWRSQFSLLYQRANLTFFLMKKFIDLNRNEFISAHLKLFFTILVFLNHKLKPNPRRKHTHLRKRRDIGAN